MLFMSDLAVILLQTLQLLLEGISDLLYLLPELQDQLSLLLALEGMFGGLLPQGPLQPLSPGFGLLEQLLMPGGQLLVLH